MDMSEGERQLIMARMRALAAELPPRRGRVLPNGKVMSLAVSQSPRKRSGQKSAAPPAPEVSSSGTATSVDRKWLERRARQLVLAAGRKQDREARREAEKRRWEARCAMRRAAGEALAAGGHFLEALARFALALAAEADARQAQE